MAPQDKISKDGTLSSTVLINSDSNSIKALLYNKSGAHYHNIVMTTL